MYKAFQSLDELFAHMREDKASEGAEATMRNRYPVRFILFENFADFNEFIISRPEGVFQHSIHTLLDERHPDLFPTHSDVATEMRDYIRGLPANDFVIFPFSELTRFYPDREFQVLVTTVRGIQPPADAQMSRARFYVPIVGMQGKMKAFMADHQTYVWEYKSPRDPEGYRLIITPGTTYGVRGLAGRYSMVGSLCQWLQLWEQGAAVRRDIICASRSIARCAHFAQPDNAFTYTECATAYEFLTRGLGLDFGGIPFSPADEKHWAAMAQQIDIEDFDFDRFISERFSTSAIADTRGFIRTWFECSTDFDRWLLAAYYRRATGGRGYLCEAMDSCAALTTPELFSAIATHIFASRPTDEAIRDRRAALAEAARHGARIPQMAESMLRAKLAALLRGEPQDRYAAAKLLTSFTLSERCLAIEALGSGRLALADIKGAYPELYHYMRPFALPLPAAAQWVADYFDAYRAAKLSDSPERVEPLLARLNASQATFQRWHDDFSTVKTLLHGRADIEKVYWIDGLGADWIPFIAHVIAEHNFDNVYLNEMHIARALLPTTTAVNRPKLEELAPAGTPLCKIGDLDAYAHSHKDFPQCVAEELRIVEAAIRKVLSEHGGGKVAIVSDHGLTYMAQHGLGLNLAGLMAEHEGRAAVASAPAAADSAYCVLDDGRTLCALTHNSLAAKTARGHGAHGGATPEEVLVPVIVISSERNASTYSARLLTPALAANSPVTRLEIRGLSTIDVPELEYNDAVYALRPEPDGTYASERLCLVDTATALTLRIGDFRQRFTIEISTGAVEDDPFGF